MTPALVALLLVLAQAPAGSADLASFQELEESLTCQCGCGLTVHSCNHLQCSSALPLRQEIREEMAKGLTKDQILAYFQQKYGEKILSSPTTSGFNLAAWTMPFVILFIGGGVVILTLRRWRRAVPAGTVPPSAPGPSPTSELERELDRELDRFDA